MTRDELIDAGAHALYGEGEEGPSEEAEQRRAGCWSLAEDVIDAVDPLIRADERERLALKWSEDSHGVRFNHAHDDLTPHQRVLKWLRGIT